MPEKLTLEEFSRLRKVTKPVPVHRNGNGGFVLKRTIHIRDPNTQNWEFAIGRTYQRGRCLNPLDQRALATFIEDGLAYFEIPTPFCTYFRKVLEDAVGSVKISLNDKGFKFVGLVVDSCPAQYKKEVLDFLRASLSELERDNRNYYVKVVDLDSKVYGDNFADRFRRDRELAPYNLLLIWDSKRISNLRGEEMYSLDLEGCLELARF